MKRKKWSEVEELTLLSKYSDLLNSGTLPKLKTREKKFKPIADHVNTLHHFQEPLTFPFKWSWRDVSIKVQNMRHQYLGVKQKIRTADNDFVWADGEIHWENFLKYKEVFGDIDLTSSPDILGYDEVDTEEEDEDEEVSGFDKKRKGLRMVLELRDVIVRREERKREREWRNEDEMNELSRKEREEMKKKEKRLMEREESVCERELELEEMRMKWAKREYERRIRVEREVDEERRRRMKLEEKWEEEEMEWRERIVEMQIEHEKQMMQMHADACQNQLQVLGVVARLVCQFFGSGNDGLGGGLGAMAPQVLQHPEGLGDSGKNDSSLPSQFL